MENISDTLTLTTLEKQQDKITKYENKIRDIVRAYKSLQNEKSALEEIVNKLSCNSKSDELVKNYSSEASVGGNGALQFEEPLGVAAVEFTEDVKELKEKLSTMTKSFAVITEEKKRKEADFQADKRRLNQEKEDLVRQLKTSRSKEKKLLEEIEQCKTRLRCQQLEREKEQNDHQFMIRELQTLVSDERKAKENLASELEEAQVLIAIKESQSENTKEYKKKITNLMGELKGIKGKLKVAEETAGKPSQLELKLQYEMAEAEAQHKVVIFREQQQTADVEERLGQLAKVGEERIAGLEARLTELSETVGTYDRQRQQDINIIQRLKERIGQLDIENAALAKAASCVGSHMDPESQSDVTALKEKITKLKGMLKGNEHHRDNDGHVHCQLKFQQLKEEFENYKMRNLKNKKENDYLKEAEKLRREMKDFTETIDNLNMEMDNIEKQHRVTVNALHSALEETKEKQKQQLMLVDVEWQGKMSTLEQQLQRQRERSFSVLEEKEKEIDSLRNQLGFGMNRRGSKGVVDWSCGEQDMNLLQDVAEELSKLTVSDKREVPFLHYAQEVARKDVEISNLRKAKHGLEMKVREIEFDVGNKEEEYTKQMDRFAEQVLRLERNNSREGANLEYLKNVVLSYMLSSSATSRHHMLNAISVVLKFSTKELESVKAYNSTWWWNQKP